MQTSRVCARARQWRSSNRDTSGGRHEVIDRVYVRTLTLHSSDSASENSPGAERRFVGYYVQAILIAGHCIMALTDSNDRLVCVQSSLTEVLVPVMPLGVGASSDSFAAESLLLQT